MQNAVDYAEVARQWARRAHEVEQKFGKYCSSPKRYSVDSMSVVVHYTAVVGRVEFSKRGEEHIFVQTKTRLDKTRMEWDEVHESPYSLRDEFFKVETVGQAIEFLQKTGEFSPLRQRLTWKEFQKWQLFARLVQEHNELAEAMRSNSWSGDCGEVLKALTGIYPSSFFDGCEDPLELHDQQKNNPAAVSRRLEELHRQCMEATRHDEWLKAHEREVKELQAQDVVEKWEREKKQNWRDLWQWFIKPPVRIEWHPINEEALQGVIKHHIDPATQLAIPIAEESPIMRGGAMMEFLLPQGQLAPVLVVHPRYALQAIAAAIYAERIQGVTYRKCGWCGELFRIGGHKNKLYCDSPKACKGNAQKKRQRAEQRQRKELTSSKSHESKARKARRV